MHVVGLHKVLEIFDSGRAQRLVKEDAAAVEHHASGRANDAIHVRVGTSKVPNKLRVGKGATRAQVDKRSACARLGYGVCC